MLSTGKTVQLVSGTGRRTAICACAGGRHPHYEERGDHIAERLPVPHDQVIGMDAAGALPDSSCHFVWSRRSDSNERQSGRSGFN